MPDLGVSITMKVKTTRKKANDDNSSFKASLWSISQMKTISLLGNFRPNNFLQVFKLTPSGTAEMVAPGLSVSGTLEFIPEKNEEVKDCLTVHIDDTETIDIPLLG